jgi:hypothetical protein
MYLYLADFVGSGSRRDPYRVPGMQPGASILDLRPDCTAPDGHAILSSPQPVRDRRLRLVAERPHEAVAIATRRLFASRLRVDAAEETLAHALFAMLVTPPSGRHAWPRLMPALLFGQWMPGRANPRRYELWLGGELVTATPVIAGGASFRDDFNRADSLGSLGGNWTLLKGNTFSITNREVLAIPGFDLDRIWKWARNCDTANHFSELRIGPREEFSNDLGPAVRVSGSFGSANCYAWTPYVKNPQVCKFVANTQTVVASVPDYDFEFSWHRLHANGSSLTVNQGPRGAQTHVWTGTDTTHASALGVGVFQYAESSVWDDWSGGDGTGEQSRVAASDEGPFAQMKMVRQNAGGNFDITLDATVAAGNSVLVILTTGPVEITASHISATTGNVDTWVRDAQRNNGTNNNIAILRAKVTSSGTLTLRINVPSSTRYQACVIETEPLIASPLTGSLAATAVGRDVDTGPGKNTAAAAGFSITAMAHDGSGSPRVTVWSPPWTPLARNTSTDGFPLIVGWKRSAAGASLQGRFTNYGDVRHYVLSVNYELAVPLEAILGSAFDTDIFGRRWSRG